MEFTANYRTRFTDKMHMENAFNTRAALIQNQQNDLFDHSVTWHFYKKRTSYFFLINVIVY